MAVHLAPAWRSRARHAFNKAVDFILPPVCAACRRVGSLLCPDCHAALSWLSPPFCARCGTQLASAGEDCRRCALTPLPLKRVRAALLYTGPLPRAIHALKYEGFFAVAAPLGGLMVDAWPRWHLPIDLVVPVPLHAEREKERGYNQSALLAKTICSSLALSGAPGALRRIRHTRPQVGLTSRERLDNVSGAFAGSPTLVKDKEVLLVDDVYTTGATLAAAATALLEAGAAGVSGYCLARATHN